MKYTPLRAGFIRLLNIDCANDKVVCRVIKTKLSSSLSFDAVSHTWGTEDRTEAIDCNGKSFPVTPSLKTMMQHLYHYRTEPPRSRRGGSSRPLWIDTICINQDDANEKEVQIQLMGTIFAGAIRVIIWIGPAGEHTDTFMDEIPSVLEALQGDGRACPFHWETPISGALEQEIPAKWAGLRDVLGRPWTTRLWTFQEGVLAKHAVVMCGLHGVHLDVLAEIDGLLEKGDFDMNLYMQTQRTARDFPYSFPFGAIGSFRSSTHGNIAPYLLSHCWGLGVKEPIDRIWSLLGLLEEGLKEEVAPLIDYSNEGREQYWKTYLRFAKTLLRHDKSLAILSLSAYEEGSKLPSWCPDFSKPIPYRTFNFEQNNYRAGILENSHHRHLRIPEVLDDDDQSLEISGFRLDAVSDVVKDSRLQQARFNVQHPTDVAAWIDWEARCRTLAQRVSCDGITTMLPHNYLRVHASDMVKDAESIYTDTGNDAITTLISLVGQQHCSNPGTNTATASVWALTSQCLRQICTDRGIPGDTQRRIAECYEAIERNIGRTFFRTYNGRLGLGPPGMEIGDAICAFFGSGPLHVLRFVEPAECATYIGDAYLDGCMRLDELDGIRGQDDVFHIR
ncbi:heterokaryon incompatibility protein [Diplodia corticola]|uniref:Heterokaryon incompatibility protein n=1 Tax=Diplodia corticola TaxID=236234 RepID=A0A1J9S163_9PEZI|nr:heterokaryon incompatibility protein [Diplodia corticola]OJD33764.1 heterokaryon incompatibility protein [Diplodia corticola]